MDEKNKWYTYIVEYYSAFKKKGILPLVIMWMKLEDIIQNEICQTNKNIA